MKQNAKNSLIAELELAAGELAQEAGSLALEYFERVESELKPDGSVVTEADRAVEQFLYDSISKRWPNSTFTGEESEYKSQGSLHWIVDPIDGTAVFAVGGSTWTVSIAVFADKKPVAAAVYCPVTRELFSMVNGVFCFNGRAKTPSAFVLSPRNVLYVPSDFATKYRIADYNGKIRSLGSGCLHIACMMAGRGDAVVLRGHVWDVAPAFAFVANSQGIICTLNGREIKAGDVMDFGRQKIEFPVIIASCAESAEYFCSRISIS